MADPTLGRRPGPVGSRLSSSSTETQNSTRGPLGAVEECVAEEWRVCEADCYHVFLDEPFLIGIAIDKYLTPQNPIIVRDPGLEGDTIRFGQDVEFGRGREAPDGESVGDSERTLKRKMKRLLHIFAAGDATGMAERLFDRFFSQNSKIEVFTDMDMEEAIYNHPHFKTFSERTLNAGGVGSGKTRIHQALRAKHWDINKIKAITDLGVPAFNRGSKVWSTKDFDNGLGVMINGVQIVLVYVDRYHYYCERNTYDIRLKFVLYDVFGLDDDDLNEYGASSDWSLSDAKQGITAWWQLQHQYGYAPLLTRAELLRSWNDVPAI